LFPAPFKTAQAVPGPLSSNITSMFFNRLLSLFVVSIWSDNITPPAPPFRPIPPAREPSTFYIPPPPDPNSRCLCLIGGPKLFGYFPPILFPIFFFLPACVWCSVVHPFALFYPSSNSNSPGTPQPLFFVSVPRNPPQPGARRLPSLYPAVVAHLDVEFPITFCKLASPPLRLFYRQISPMPPQQLQTVLRDYQDPPKSLSPCVCFVTPP